MCYVNYVRESIAFMDFARDEMLTANERLLWYALLHIMNKRATGSDWPEGFISVTNREVLSFCPFGDDSLATARNKLKQRGLIDYIQGEKNKKAPQYRMRYFYPESSTELSTEMKSYPIFSGNIPGNNGGNIGGNDGGNIPGNNGGNIGGIYINNNGKRYPLPNQESNINTLERANFTPPMPEEVEAFCKAEGIKVDAKRFCAWYSSKGWMVGDVPMVDWKGSVRCWTDPPNQPAYQPTQRPPKKVHEQCYAQREYSDEPELPEWMRRRMDEMSGAM